MQCLGGTSTSDPCGIGTTIRVIGMNSPGGTGTRSPGGTDTSGLGSRGI